MQIFFIYGFFLRGKFNVFINKVHTFTIKLLKMTIKVSIGELFDKITILEIKRFKITQPKQLQNVLKEYKYLRRKARKLDNTFSKSTHFKKLMDINTKLWDIEDAKRECERKQKFGAAFIELARNVYIYNDKRAAIKKAINKKYDSDIVEEKSYKKY
jgi:hypothetical protein